MPLKIGSLQLDNSLILAPMAGITSLPFRRIMKSFGAALVFTEMISANGLIRDGRRTLALLESCPEEKPLAVQLFGDDPQVLAQGATMVGPHADLLDINMGCPVKKVVRSGAGSALLRDPNRVGRIIEAVRAAFPGPLTLKIRSGWDQTSINFLEVGRIAKEAGADAICLHPRTRSQNFGGKADWKMIAELKSSLDIPVIGSGDLFNAADIESMFRQTLCDAVMVARGCYGNPWIFQQAAALLRGAPALLPGAADRGQTALQHLNFHAEHFGEHKALLEMRKHLSWYVRGLTGAHYFRGQLQKIESWPELLLFCETFFNEQEGAELA
ncbi:tRNA dihydrouridine synthase DusB [Geopsychrobacter electrodiphilus]|uniref:tRNA dihydrouridine synthase DusB n=1 Tax=Geopsychrobacter electrodiphilus TaxID=225196 RepID=UPI0003691147|nr:tRNA dihydrouridine synthase DusB [Geopsychrobacter electrodiphilus]